jgi:hypothetical protein
MTWLKIKEKMEFITGNMANDPFTFRHIRERRGGYLAFQHSGQSEGIFGVVEI